MSLLIRKYKSVGGMMQEERIDEPDRIERYMRLFDKDDIKKLETGVKVFIEKLSQSSTRLHRRLNRNPIASRQCVQACNREKWAMVRSVCKVLFL